MKYLNLKLNGTSTLQPTILIDDKIIKPKKNKFGNYEISYETEKDKANVAIYKYLELNSRLWFLFSLLFYIISIFGIFDVPYDKKCIVLDCKFEVDLSEQENDVLVKLNPIRDSGEAMKIESERNINILNNSYFVDKKAKRRRKLMVAMKVLGIIAGFVGIFYFIVRWVIG